jgi:catechol 2,3-dioxygenase-like lactoylglutathione lyase family enzyme
VLDRIFHLAVNATNLERSVAFYRKLGFTEVSEREVHNPQVKAAFAVPSGDLRFVHLRLGESEDATLLDVVQWYDPPTEAGDGKPVAQHRQGLTRFAVLTQDTQQVYEKLRADDVEFLTEPTTVMTPNGGWKVCLAVDPDGVVVQITELVPAAAA